MASKQDNSSLVAGIQLAQKRRETVKGGDGFPSPRDMKENTVEKEMQIDFKKPLQDALKNVFDHCGKVVLAFPYSTQAQVKGFVDYIRNAVPTSHCKLQEQTRTTTCFSMCGLTERQVAEEFNECPDIDVELVGVTISRPIFLIQLSQLIDEIIHKFRNLPNPRNPTVDVVMLLDPSETQALKVRTGEVQTGQVYFESINPESLDPYLFFRVQFFSTQRGHERDFVTIWISAKTLYPIGITTNDELFAVLPQSTIFPAVCPSATIESPSVIIDESLPADTDPFSWLQEILNQPNKYFFREASIGGDVIVIHPANATINRRVTRQEEIAIVADNNQWEFAVFTFTVTNS